MESNHDASHNHAVSNIKMAFFLNLFFAIFEIVGSFFTHSLAVLSTGLHDLGDSLSLGSSWYLEKISRNKRNVHFSYGYRRFSLLAAVISSLILLIGSFFIISESFDRLLHPEHSNAGGMILFAIFGIAVNLIAVLRLKKGKSLNEKVIIWHLLDDVFGWAAVLVVAVVIIIRDMHFLDPLLSLLITVYVLWKVLKNFKKTILIFLQGVPESINISLLEGNVKAIKGVQALHDTHVWSLDGQYNILTTHIMLGKDLSQKEILDIKCKAKELIQKNNIQHVTIEMEQPNETCKTKYC